ncbi:hypothetical protein KBI52_12160 [Microvirga sp. HBU67558]|uniref:hypothetical protein n=1 Tax=Microvirga sp. HBU67558 TaxID=2824562 RepID=UPI001B35BAFB|nr:hypothetical protein [Microvirga sp. HBU67558]MBQ0820960.1 hypothetical protein [Microvirga sp. HBU67558]
MTGTPTATEPPILTEDEIEARFIVLQEILLGTHALATKFIAEIPSPSGQPSSTRAELYLENLAIMLEKTLNEQPSAIREEGKTYAAVNTVRLHNIIKDNWPKSVQ